MTRHWLWMPTTVPVVVILIFILVFLVLVLVRPALPALVVSAAGVLCRLRTSLLLLGSLLLLLLNILLLPVIPLLLLLDVLLLPGIPLLLLNILLLPVIPLLLLLDVLLLPDISLLLLLNVLLLPIVLLLLPLLLPATRFRTLATLIKNLPAHRFAWLVVITAGLDRALLIQLARITAARVIPLIRWQRRGAGRGATVPAIPSAALPFPVVAPVFTPARGVVVTPAAKISGRAAIVAHWNAQYEQRHIGR